MKLSPRWLYAAVVKKEDGSRMGTISAVNGDAVTILVKGVAVTASAKELDAAGRLEKSRATCPKYIK